MKRARGLLQLVAACIACTGLAMGSVAADRRIAVADPYFGMLLEGRVLDARGAPLADVELMRMAAAEGDEPFDAGLYRTTTNAAGLFQFAHAGIGLSTGRTWHLRARRADCTTTRVTVTLEEGEYRGREASVKTGVEIRLQCPTPR